MPADTPRYTGIITEEMADCIREGRYHTDRPSYGHALAMEVLALEAWELAPAVRQPRRAPERVVVAWPMARPAPEATRKAA